MADEEIRQLLTDWGLEDVIRQFEENGIDKAAFKLLDKTVIQELIPKIGSRLKFISKFKEYHAGAQSEHVGMNQARPQPEHVDAVADQDGDCDVLPTTPCAEKRRRIHFDIRGIISKYARGGITLSAIQKNRAVNPGERKVIVHALVTHLIDTYGENPHSTVKEVLAENLIEEFPCLKDPMGPTGHEAWFIKGMKGRPATGYLEARLRYVRMNLNRVSQEDKTGGKQKQQKPEKQEQHNKKEDFISDEAEADMLKWLQHNNTPPEKIKDFMLKTTYSRYRWIRKEGERPSVGDILKRYPRLLDPGMIEQDFAATFLSEEKDKFFTAWPKYAKKLLDYGEARCPPWKALILIENYLQLSQEEQEVLAFSVLPLICRGRSKGRGKCSFKESLEAFIDIKPEGTDVEFYVSKIDRNVRPQPFILLLGDSRVKPLQSFVIVERRALLFETLTKAVDYAFKLHYVLDLKYQSQCYPAWQFLQMVLYQLPGDETSSTVRELRTYINSLKE